jgi:hypothetical protein
MPVHYWVGDGFIDMRQLESLASRGDLQELERGRGSIEHRGARVRLESLAAASEPFSPIGLGKPLSIRMHSIYVGKLPGYFKKDVLAVSGVKSVETFETAARAVNLIQSGVADHEFAEFSAFRQNSPIVYYSTAVTNYDLVASVEVIPDTFKEETVQKVSGLFGMAAGLPVFAPAGTYLLAGSCLMKIFSDLGRVFFQKGPILSHTLKLNFGVAGLPLFREGFYIVSNESSLSAFEGYSPQIVNGSVKLGKGSRVYDGDIPYVILGVDGRQEPALEGFRPQLASAAVLEKFYPKEDGFNVLIDELGEAMRLYSDLSFRTKAEDVRKRLSRMKESDPDYARLNELFEAYRKNITQEELKLT